MTGPAPAAVTQDLGDDDLEQTDTHPTTYPALGVSVEGIARVRTLPSRRATFGHVPVAAGETVRIVGRMDQRASITVWPTASDVYVSNRAEAGATGAPLVRGAGASLDYSGELWAHNASLTDTDVGFFFTLVEE